ncbi:DUF6438 domain-containing protein [Chitinophaga filiformis]|uniref:DUF6438 domain-containing protein n=1 Tax=Chitinophaga filiformis TaxID=104663 RepID=UPI001F3618B0|nr:DUF6438 domain-containing protein [Chitinophaga filiformis]MCF6403142.1 DUF6438 domain-containing protein [Chitinophaga filiformis]
MKTAYFLALILLLTNCAEKKTVISRIDFEADGCFGTCPVFTMSILEDGTAYYDAQMYNDQEGKFKTILEKAQLDSLKQLIELGNIPALRDNYSIPVTDHPTYTLRVQYNNGLQKEIRDYGPGGPDKLIEIYHLIFSLRKTQNWK